jgi:DNA repair exonuclease SbcCD nuclease subunit
MGFSFLHAADLHLDTPFHGLGRPAEHLRTRLVDASLDALDALVDRALAEGVLFVALAGDVYDGADRGLRAQARLLAATRRLDAAGIHTFIAHGNHDPVNEGWAAIRRWPDRVHVFSARTAETHRLTAADGTPVTVTGTSYPVRDVREGLHPRFARPDGPGFHVAVLHANVGASPEHAAYSPCRLEDLEVKGYDAWLLGHIHRRAVLKSRAPFVAYPGNLQGRSFKATECGPKGALLVRVESGLPTPTFLDLAPVRFESLEVDATPCHDLGAVIDALLHAADAVRDAGRLVMVRATVRGRTPAHDDLARTPVETLLETLRDARPTDGLFWSELRLEAHPERALEALRDRDDLAGELVREMEFLRGDPVLLRSLLDAAAHPVFRELLPGTDAATLETWLTQAAEHALFLLEGEV